MRPQQLRISSVVFCAAVFGSIVANSPAGAQSAAEQAAPSVVVIEAATQDVTEQFEYPGRAEAVERVEIRARVEGFLETRNFREGSEVTAGDVLFTIERAPYEVVVEQRQSELASAQATVISAEADYNRKAALAKRKDVSQADLDTARATLDTARASVMGAKAALRAAQLDLAYTTIKSPIDGRISQATYSIGNLVNSSSDPLATVTSINPIHVNIQVSEEQLTDARKRGINLDNPPVAPVLTLSDGSTYPSEGTFDFLAPSVDQGTDTVTARATFPNPNHLLLPGQFLNVVVRQKTPETALTVPQASIQQDSQGYFLLVVDSSDVAQIRRVKLGRQVKGNWIVTDGLAAGERVIVQGIQKARPGAKVSPTVQGKTGEGS